jgi:hypothetical protein
MKNSSVRAFRRPSRLTWWAVLCASIAAITAIVLVTQSAARAAQAPVGLGTAASFSVLAGSTVTNTGASNLAEDLGLSPGTAVTGFPPGLVLGTTQVANGVALQAQSDLTTAYNDAAGRTPATSIGSVVGGQTLAPGVYNAPSALQLNGTLTLNANGDPTAVFIFQVGSALTTASSSLIALIGDAQACNVFWQIGSSATLGTGSGFVGNLLALTSIAATTGATIQGRLLARNGAVTLDDNLITAPGCATTLPTPTPTPTATVAPTGTPTVTPTGTATPTGVPIPTPTRTVGPTGTPIPVPTPTGTATRTPIPVPTPTRTVGPTGIPVPTPTGTASPTGTATAKPTVTPTATPTQAGGGGGGGGGGATPTPTGTTAPAPTPVTTYFPVTG